MNFEEAKAVFSGGGDVYRAYYDGSVWSAGRMVEVGETIGYYTTEEDARKACADYEMIDFDREHLQTDVEKCGKEEFDA